MRGARRILFDGAAVELGSIPIEAVAGAILGTATAALQADLLQTSTASKLGNAVGVFVAGGEQTATGTKQVATAGELTHASATTSTSSKLSSGVGSFAVTGGFSSAGGPLGGYVEGQLSISIGHSFTASAARGGVVPSWFKRKERKILITLDGNRFLVPESEIANWLTEKVEEVAEQVPVKKVKGQKQEAVPEIKAKVSALDDMWITRLVADANRQIKEASRAAAEAKRAIADAMDEEDIEILLLAL